MAHSRGLSLQRWLLPPTLLATAIALRPAPAAACSYVIQAIDVSYPEPEAVDVPTNAALFVYGHNLNSAGIRLLDASGADVPVQVQPAEPSGWDVFPLAPLEAGRPYRLIATGSEYDARTVVPFTTGSGPAAVPARMETPEIDVAVILYPPGPCGEQQGVCVATAAAPGTTLEVRIGAEVLRGPLPGFPARWFGAYGTFFPEGACLEVRARDVRGRRSAPRTVCGADAQRIEVPPDAALAYTCENYSSLIQDAERESTSDQDPRPIESSDTAVSTSSAAEGGVPLPRDVTYAASNATDPAAADGCGCKLTSNGASRSSAGLLSIGWIALSLLRRRHGRR